MTVRRESWPAGTPCWTDLSVPDLSAAKAFYSSVLGWELEDQGEDFGNYHMARVNGVDAAGIGPLMQPDQPSVWTLYLASDDIAATSAAIAANGGTVLMDTMPIPEDGSLGHMLIAMDPTGAAFGVWQAGSHIGSSLVNEPGGITWEDLRSPDPVAARDFYTKVFGYGHAPVEGLPPGQDYMTFDLGSDPLGGMGDMMGMSDVPPHWAVYFGTDNVDAALTRVTGSGGTVIAPGFDTPYGRMACVADPAGAMFWLVEVPAAA